MFRRNALKKLCALLAIPVTVALIVILVTTLFFGRYGPIRAQGQELLQNPNLDSYYGIGGESVVPTGWRIITSIPVRSAQQKWLFNEFPGFTASWEINGPSTVFMMVGYQFVPGVRAGTKLRFSAYSNLFTCNNKETSCIGNDGKRVSDQASQARTRIGVDPTGGTDSNSPNIIWSSYISPFDTFQQNIIDFESKNDNGVTVYVNATQAVGLALNIVYWDKMSLQAIGPGVPGGPTATEVPRFVPFVTPQGQQADGSIVHIVGPGDTLASIALAYKTTIEEIRKLNKMPEGEYVIRIGQKLIIKTPGPAITYVVVTATPTFDGTPRTATPDVSTKTPGGNPLQIVTVTRTPTGTLIQPKRTIIVITLAPPTP